MMPNPWIILALTLAWFSSLAAVGHWQHGAGEVAERVIWQGKQTKELVATNSEITRLQKSVTDNKKISDASAFEISKHYQVELENVSTEKAKFIAGVRNGSIVLRQPRSVPSAPTEGAARESGTSSSGCDETSGSELQEETSEFLYTEASRADEIVEQLQACQDLLVSDRLLCKIVADVVE